MDMEVEVPAFINADEFKPDLDTQKPICRFCFTNNKRLTDIKLVENEILFLANIYVSDNDGLPQTICYECHALLWKAVKFKQKMTHSNYILQDYASKCVPFPIDYQDPTLQQSASPLLDRSQTLVVDSCTPKLGFHCVLDHKNVIQTTEEELEYSQEDGQQNGGDFSDYEDNLTLDVFRSNVTKLENETMSEEELASLLALSLPEEAKKGKRTKKKIVKGKKKKKDQPKVKREDQEDREEQVDEKRVRKSIRKPLDLDPAKIKVINLNPEEQIKQREEESKLLGGRFPYSCHLCFKGFNFESKLQNHMYKHSPSRGSFKCRLCQMYLPTAYSFGVHMAVHTTRYQCTACGVTMASKVCILEHYKRQHDGIFTIYKCHLCGKISSNNKTHRGHLRNHHSGSRPKCHLCDKTFINADSLNQHLQIHSGAKNYTCCECGMKFRNRTGVKLHQLSHTDRKDHYCVECDVRFKSAHSLRQHLIKSSKHRDENSLKYSCTSCGKRFLTPSALSSHVAIQHDGIRPHRCRQCPAALATLASLRKHERYVHSGLKPTTPTHVCDTCGKAFKSRSVLINHVRTHTGEKPHSCDRCGRPFAQKSALNTHINLVHLHLKRNSKSKPEPRPVMDWIKPPPPCDAFFPETKPLDYN